MVVVKIVGGEINRNERKTTKESSSRTLLVSRRTCIITYDRCSEEEPSEKKSKINKNSMGGVKKFIREFSRSLSDESHEIDSLAGARRWRFRVVNSVFDFCVLDKHHHHQHDVSLLLLLFTLTLSLRAQPERANLKNGVGAFSVESNDGFVRGGEATMASSGIGNAVSRILVNFVIVVVVGDCA